MKNKKNLAIKIVADVKQAEKSLKSFEDRLDRIEKKIDSLAAKGVAVSGVIMGNDIALMTSKSQRQSKRISA